MASPVDAVALYLQDQGLGAVGTAVFKEQMPDAADGSLDTVTVVYDTGGAPPGLTQGDNTDQPSWQLRARSLDAATALGNLQTAFQALHGLTETTLHGVHFKLVWALNSNPISLGRDEKQRYEFVWNFRAMVAGITR